MSVTEHESTPSPEPVSRSDHNSWYWLLAVPVIVPLLTFVYNGADPVVGGIPKYYWLQFLFVALSVGCTLVVYRQTKGR